MDELDFEEKMIRDLEKIINKFSPKYELEDILYMIISTCIKGWMISVAHDSTSVDELIINFNTFKMRLDRHMSKCLNIILDAAKENNKNE